MSLYNFFESYIEENPEFITMQAVNSLHYNELISYFKQKVKIKIIKAQTSPNSIILGSAFLQIYCPKFEQLARVRDS